MMSKLKLFISQPMQNKSPEEISTEKQKCIDYFQELITKLNKIFNEPVDFEIINSYIEEQPSSDVQSSELWYLGKSLELLSTADIIVFAKGWRKARGCRIEYKCAEDYKITILECTGV